MEQVILILMSFIVVNTIIKLSFWKWWQTGIFSLICSLFICMIYPYAIEQSKLQIEQFLSSSQIRQNTSVLVTIESAIYFFFCFIMLRDPQKKKKKWMHLLYWYPGLLIFLVLFYALTQAMFAFTGSDFNHTAYSFAILVFIAIPLFSFLVKKIIPESELRLEVFFLLSLIVCILGLLTTVNADVVYKGSEETINKQHLLFSLLLFLFFFIVGFYEYKIKWIIKNKKIKK